MDRIAYSIIVPVYNSEATLPELYRRLAAYIEKQQAGWEFVFVDDGSRDESWKLLQDIKRKDKRVTAIRLNKNFGQHNATFCGFTFAKGSYMITIDDDLQIPPEEIGKLIDSMKEDEADLVYGLFKNKKHSTMRNLGSKYAKKSSRIWMGRPGEGSSFRLISRELTDKIVQHHQNFVFIDEILHWYTDNISYVEVEHKKREASKSGYSTFRLFNMVSNVVIYYTSIPLKLMVYGGFIASVVFLLVSIYYILLKIFFDVPLGYTSIIVGIMLSTSLILFCLGVIGEYLRRIYMVQNRKPPYQIKKVLQ